MIGKLRWRDRFLATWRVLTAKQLVLVTDNVFENFPRTEPLIAFSDVQPPGCVIVMADNQISYRGEEQWPTNRPN